MKAETYFGVGMAAAFLLLLAGCGGRGQVQAETQRFSLDGVSELVIAYDEEAVTLFRGEGEELVIREYMTKNKERYHAKVSRRGDSLHISEGGKPFFHAGFSRYVEVYLPASFHQELTVITTNGTINLTEVDLELERLRVESTAGTVRIGSVTAGDIRLSTTSGGVTCAMLNGKVSFVTTSGSADIRAAVGSGSYTSTNSGRLSVAYTRVTGDLSLYGKNGDVILSLPEELDFTFEAATKNGSISTAFRPYLSENGKTVSGTVGEWPGVRITVETKNGDIQVLRG